MIKEYPGSIPATPQDEAEGGPYFWLDVDDSPAEETVDTDQPSGDYDSVPR